jgi:hypothetical protein
MTLSIDNIHRIKFEFIESYDSLFSTALSVLETMINIKVNTMTHFAKMGDAFDGKLPRCYDTAQICRDAKKSKTYLPCLHHIGEHEDSI